MRPPSWPPHLRRRAPRRIGLAERLLLRRRQIKAAAVAAAVRRKARAREQPRNREGVVGVQRPKTRRCAIGRVRGPVRRHAQRRRTAASAAVLRMERVDCERRPDERRERRGGEGEPAAHKDGAHAARRAAPLPRRWRTRAAAVQLLGPAPWRMHPVHGTPLCIGRAARGALSARCCVAVI